MWAKANKDPKKYKIMKMLLSMLLCCIIELEIEEGYFGHLTMVRQSRRVPTIFDQGQVIL